MRKIIDNSKLSSRLFLCFNLTTIFIADAVVYYGNGGVAARLHFYKLKRFCSFS